MNDIDLLHKSRPYVHQVSGIPSVATNATSFSFTNSVCYNAASTTAADSKSMPDWVHIVNLGTTNSFWEVGTSAVAARTPVLGCSEPCLANGGDLWLELETDAIPIIKGIADTSAGNHCINWYKSRPPHLAA